jgi:hypothetical protein
MTKLASLSVTVAGAAALALTFMGTETAKAQSGSSEVWTVVIDIFSGRPNPKFTLDAAEVQEVKARLGRAPAMSTAAMPDKTIRPARLGYRGILLKSSAGARVVEDSEVSKGKIFRKGPGAKALMDDKAAGAGIERYLTTLAVSKGVLTPALGEEIMKAIP